MSCPIKNRSCDNFCAWYDKSARDCRLIINLNAIGENLKEINKKLLDPEHEDAKSIRELQKASLINNMEVQHKTAALLDSCSQYISSEIAKPELSLERWDT